ncbi:MAG: hypothetical protein Q9170_002911 [Blastenia crenularia]
MAHPAPGKGSDQVDQPPEIDTTDEYVPKPIVKGNFEIDQSVSESLPVPGSRIVAISGHGVSLWGTTSKVIARLPSGEIQNYFLKVLRLGSIGKGMCEGEFESLQEMYRVSPTFVPEPYAWGKYSHQEPETYFLLTKFREISRQPAGPAELGSRLADLHLRSQSPTGKFGFHIATCHAKAPQKVDCWEESWCVLFSNHLREVLRLAEPIFKWPKFDVLSRLALEKVVPRLLIPLQAKGRMLKPCLLHGDCWDGNTAMDANTGEAFVFDACSFYGHNEYDVGNWRASRHKLSDRAYVDEYMNVFDDMTALCQRFCADELQRAIQSLEGGKIADGNHGGF